MTKLQMRDLLKVLADDASRFKGFQLVEVDTSTHRTRIGVGPYEFERVFEVTVKEVHA